MEKQISIVTCFLAGGDFKAEHVQRLSAMAPGLVCITNEHVDGVKTLPMPIEWPGWWCKMNAYNTDLFSGDMLLIDLDTTILNMPAMPTETTVLNDFYRPELMGSGLVYMTESDRKRVYTEWIKHPDKHMACCRTRERWGDQGFLADIIPHAKRWGSNIRSYKVHCRHGVPAGTDIICYHGKPRPWEVER